MIGSITSGSRGLIPVLFLLALLASCAAPRAKFSVTQEEMQAPAQVRFENASTEAESYEWQFGDGTKSEEIQPSHQYLSSGKYEIRLKAIKGNKTHTTTKEIIVEPPEKCLVSLETEYGKMLIELSDETPKHRDNFFKLAEEGFYDDLIFHRVINGFMIQGGDPNSRNADGATRLGTGGPGYQVDAEFRSGLVHTKGAIAAARTGDQVNPERKSSGSQFYIVQGAEVSEAMLGQMESRKGQKYSESQIKQYLDSGGTPFLDWEYTVFGQVIEGLDVIDKIAAVKTKPGDRPDSDIKMKMRVIK